MRPGLGAVLSRIVAIIAGLVVLGVVLKLLAAVLQPVLPGWLFDSLNAGWGLLLGVIGPALAPLAAIGIVGALVWVFMSRRW